MTSISRKLPNSNPSRLAALRAAKEKKDTVLPANMAITPGTITRLDAIYALYDAGMLDIAGKKSVSALSTLATQIEFRKSKMFTSHFIQVFNLGVMRGKYLKEHRAYYKLDINQDSVPRLSTAADVIEWGQNLKVGDPLRVTAGGAAMANPAIAECNIPYDAFTAAHAIESNDKESLDMAQEKVEALNTEADKVIKKVWDEVETFYNEEEPSSMRANAREWGVVYISLGDPSTLNINILSDTTALPVEGASVWIATVGDEKLSDADGNAQLVTRVVGDDTLMVEHPLYEPFELPITIDEASTQTVKVKVQPKP